MTFEEWWNNSDFALKDIPETYAEWEESCREAFYAGRKTIDLDVLADCIHCHTDASKQDAKEIARLFINKQTNGYSPLPEA